MLVKCLAHEMYSTFIIGAHERGITMGKGGTDNLVRARLERLLETHPYEPKEDAREFPDPYLLDDAVRDLYIALTDEELTRILLHTSVQSNSFPNVHSALGVLGQKASTVLAGLAYDIFVEYAKESDKLMAE